MLGLFPSPTDGSKVEIPVINNVSYVYLTWGNTSAEVKEFNLYGSPTTPEHTDLLREFHFLLEGMKPQMVMIRPDCRF